MRPRSLALRLALLAGLLGLAQAAAVLYFAYVTFGRELDVHRRTEVHERTEQVRRIVSELPDATAISDVSPPLVELIKTHAGLHLVIASIHSPHVLAAFSREASESLSRLRTDVWDSTGFLEWRSTASDRSLLSLAVTAQTRDRETHKLVVSLDRTDDARLLHNLLVTTATAAPFALAVVLLGALGIAVLGLRPLNRFREAVSRVSASTLSERLDTRGLPAELHQLAGAFNAMLDRLDEGFRRLSEFSADLAHEIRTPLATLLGRTQVALSQPRSSDQLKEVLESNLEEVQRLSRLVADMLFLAQADHAHAALELVTLDLADEGRKVAEFLELLAEERGVSIIVDGSARVSADRGLLRRAVTNLLTNALRHSRAGSRIHVVASADASSASLAVTNHGEPIPAEHLPRLFDRFYRVDTARGRDRGGAGLGLAIVATIMQLHAGRVEVSSSADGETRFALHFPL